MTLDKLTDLERDFLRRLRDRVELRPAFRDEDRARQSCRRRGFAKVEMNPRRWVLTDNGRACLEAALRPGGGE
jgi:hypothetical protein